VHPEKPVRPVAGLDNDAHARHDAVLEQQLRPLESDLTWEVFDEDRFLPQEGESRLRSGVARNRRLSKLHVIVPPASGDHDQRPTCERLVEHLGVVDVEHIAHQSHR
jgi:hypothetical protein